MCDERLKRIKHAYYQAESEQSADYGPLPKWETLPVQVREAILHVYLVARLDCSERNEGKPVSAGPATAVGDAVGAGTVPDDFSDLLAMQVPTLLNARSQGAEKAANPLIGASPIRVRIL